MNLPTFTYQNKLNDLISTPTKFNSAFRHDEYGQKQVKPVLTLTRLSSKWYRVPHINSRQRWYDPPRSARTLPQGSDPYISLSVSSFSPVFSPSLRCKQSSSKHTSLASRGPHPLASTASFSSVLRPSQLQLQLQLQQRQTHIIPTTVRMQNLTCQR